MSYIVVIDGRIHVGPFKNRVIAEMFIKDIKECPYHITILEDPQDYILRVAGEI